MAKKNTVLANNELEVIKQLKNQYERDLRTLTDTYNAFFNGYENTPSYQSRMDEINTFFENNYHGQIEEYYEEIFDGEDSTKSQIDSLVETLNNQKNKIEILEDKIFGKIIETSRVDSDGNPVLDVDGVQIIDEKQTDGLEQKLKRLYADNDSKFESLYEDVNSKSYEMLGGATSAGLAHAYSRQSREHCSLYKSAKTKFFWNIFGLSVIALVLIALPIAFESFRDFLSLDYINNPISSILKILPITAPFIWLALVIQKDIAVNSRLYAEYKHKENFCRTFIGLEREIMKSGQAEELKTALLNAMVEVNSFNPSNTIDKHKAEMPIQTLCKETGDFIKKLEIGDINLSLKGKG